MSKQEFLSSLEERLAGLPEKDIKATLDYYAELIDDMLEEGQSEEQAVENIGSVDAVAAQSLSVIPLPKLVKNKVKRRRRLSGTETVLLILGSPIWLSLVIALICIVIAFFAVLWAAVICVWALFVSLMAASAGCIFAAAVMMVTNSFWAGLFCIGAAFICAGLAFFAFFASKYSALGAAKLCRIIVVGIKKLLIRKEKTI